MKEIEEERQQLTLAQTSPQELVAFWTDTRELARFVYTLVLAKVTGVAAFVYVCRERQTN